MILFTLSGFVLHTLLRALLSRQSWGRIDTPSRVAVAASATLVLTCMTFSRQLACGYFIGYVASHLVWSLSHPQASERTNNACQLNGSVLLLLCGFWGQQQQQQATNFASASETLLRKVLLMEVAELFVQLLWLTSKEREFGALKPTLFFQAFTALGLDFWYCVIGSSRLVGEFFSLLSEQPRTEYVICFCLICTFGMLHAFKFYGLLQFVMTEHNK